MRSLAETYVQLWNWWTRVQKKAGHNIQNITESLDTKNNYKPSWVLLTKEEIKELCKRCSPTYEALIWFMIDTGVRPQELSKILVSDVSKDDNGVTWLDVRAEIAKKGSFGRKIKLLLCDTLIWKHIERSEISNTDKLFDKSNEAAKKYLRRRTVDMFGKQAVSPARDHYKNLSLYDLRHNAAAYWRQRAQTSEKFNAYPYRFGWKNPERAFYYDEYLGFKDTFEKEDLASDVERTKIQEELTSERRKREHMEQEVSAMQEQMKELQEAVEVNRMYDLLNQIRTQTESKGADAPL